VRARRFFVCYSVRCHFPFAKDDLKPIKLRVPREESGDLHDDLNAWASTSGIDPGLTIVNEPGMTANTRSPAVYLVYVSESFFDQFPEWRMYIEH
jgi:hypothetical protein